MRPDPTHTRWRAAVKRDTETPGRLRGAESGAAAAARAPEGGGEEREEAMAAIGSSNIGFQLLKKSGWKEGTGLGAQEQGRLEPVETRVKNNKRGIGSKEPKPKPKVEDDVEKDPKKPKQDTKPKKRAKLAAKRIRKMHEEEKRLQEKEFEMAFFREFWPDNV
ncbi:unnamed protein product [Urochloa decumbens]|uniref:G-patch domain-containing protein n=1 Tax=Urochloa decumbens TaxID=240449 RepID=A0ABC8XZM0_9POAL